MSNIINKTEEEDKNINATANEQTANEQTENTTANVTAWERPLSEFEEWEIAKAGLRAWVDDLDAKKLGEVFESKARKTAPFSFQMLAIITHQSAGYIGDKWNKHKENALQTCLKNKEEYNEQTAICEFILNSLAPNLAEARAERERKRAEITAKWNDRVNKILTSVSSILETWDEFSIPLSVESIAKIAPKYLNKEHGAEILATIANEHLSKEDRARVSVIIGCDENATEYAKEQFINSYWVDSTELNNVPQWYIDEQEQNENA